jgi:hypothetical protein
MQDEEALANEIASIMLKSDSFAKLDVRGWKAKRDEFIAGMVKRYGRKYPHDVIRRVAEVEFEIGLEIIKLRDSKY